MIRNIILCLCAFLLLSGAALAKEGDWENYRRLIKTKWKKYVEECNSGTDGGSMGIDREALILMANRLAIELWIEPELWLAAKDKAGETSLLKATVRKLLEMWVDGDVDPWEDEED